MTKEQEGLLSLLNEELKLPIALSDKENLHSLCRYHAMQISKYIVKELEIDPKDRESFEAFITHSLELSVAKRFAIDIVPDTDLIARNVKQMDNISLMLFGERLSGVCFVLLETAIERSKEVLANRVMTKGNTKAYNKDEKENSLSDVSKPKQIVEIEQAIESTKEDSKKRGTRDVFR